MMMAVDFKLLKSYIQSIFGVSLTPYQIKIVGKILLDDDKRIIITAPTRAGKTLAVSIAILLWVTWKPNSKVVIIAPTYDQTQIIINYIADFLIQSPILANYVDLDVSRKDVSRLKKEFSRSRITFKNGSELLVLSAQGKAERLMGHGADLVVVDESSLISDEVFNLRIMRMLGDDPNAKLLEIGNPFHLNHFYKHWYDPNFTQIHISLEETIEAGRLSPDFVEEMKRTLLPQEFKILYEAQFVEEEENALIPYKDLMWAIKNYNDVKILRNYQIYIGCDIARYGEDKTVISVVKTNQDMFKLVNITVKQKESLMETVGVIVNLIKYYNPDYVGIDDSGLGCLIKDTEVFLVEKGWTPIQEVKKGDLIYSKDKQGNVTIEKVIENKLREKTTVLINNKGYGFSFSHFLPYKTRKEYKFKLGTWDEIIKKDCVWLDNSFNWRGKPFKVELPAHKIIMPHGGVREYHRRREIDGRKFAKFLGWFLSEGWVNSKQNDGEMGISQSIKSKYLNDIKEVLEECEIKYYPKRCGNEIHFIINDIELKKWVMKNCYIGNKYGALTKCVPSVLKMADKESINNFLNEFVKGDGYYHHGIREYVTSSKRLAEDILELVYKSGRYGNIRVKHKKGSKGIIEGRTIKRTKNCYVVYEWKSKNITIGSKEKQFKEIQDNVYELKITGETKLFPVRFKDKRMFWVHNGGVTDRLIELGHQVTPINFGEKPQVNNRALNRKAEIYLNLQSLFRDHRIVIPNNPFLINQLRPLKLELTSGGKYRINDNQDKSPDYADSLAIACAGILTTQTEWEVLEGW